MKVSLQLSELFDGQEHSCPQRCRQWLLWWPSLLQNDAEPPEIRWDKQWVDQFHLTSQPVALVKLAFEQPDWRAVGRIEIHSKEGLGSRCGVQDYTGLVSTPFV